MPWPEEMIIWNREFLPKFQWPFLRFQCPVVALLVPINKWRNWPCYVRVLLLLVEMFPLTFWLVVVPFCGSEDIMMADSVSGWLLLCSVLQRTVRLVICIDL